MHIIRAQFLLVSLVAITLPLEIGCGGSQMGGSGGQGGGPGWSEGSVHSLATGKVPASLAVGDFNSDGKPDLAVANAGEPVLGEYIDSSVTVLLGNGDGTFQAVDYPTEAGSVYGSVAVGDFNGDKKLDLLASGYLLVGNGDGTFQTSLATGSGAKVLAADFNGDAKLDLAENGAPVLFAKAGEVSVQLGNGDGTFQSPVVYGLNLETSVPGLGGGDLNGDGKPDWAVTACGPVCSLYVFLSNGDGTFESLPPVGIWSVLSGPGATSIAMGDFDGDGKTDLAVPWDQGSNQGVSVLLGNGDGTFQTKVDYGTGKGPSSIAVADLNADGKLDLAITNGVDNTVSVLLGNGDGSFQAHVDYAVGKNPSSVAIGDFNGDGTLDLAVTNMDDNTVTILLGARSGMR